MPKASPLQRAAEDVALRQRDGQRVARRAQALQIERAVRAGHGLRGLDAGAVGREGHRRAGEGLFALVPLAVGVEVLKDRAAEIAQRHRARRGQGEGLAHDDLEGAVDGVQPVVGHGVAALGHAGHFAVLPQQVVQGVAARHHAVEEVGAVLGGRLGQVDFAVLGHQAHLRAQHADLVFVPQAVVVHVVEEHATDRGGGQHAGVDPGEGVAHGDVHFGGHAQIANQRGHVAAALLGGAQARKAVARLALHRDGVGAGHDAFEGVFASAVGGGGGDGLAVGIQGVDLEAGEALVAFAQHAVIARVLEHHAAHGRGARHAHQRRGFAAAAKRQAADGELPPRGALLEAVDLGRAALVGHGEDGAVVWQDGAQLVVAAAQALQAEGAVLAGNGLALGFGAAPTQGLHRHPGVARLALVPAAVVVQVQKRHAADHAVFDHADVLVRQAGGVAHGKLARDVGPGEDRAQVPAGLRIAGVEHALGQSGGDGIHVVGQKVKEIHAGFVGGDVTHRARAAALDVHGHAGHAGLVLAHDAVVVDILKHLAAQCTHGGHGQSKGLLLAGGEGNVQINDVALHAAVGETVTRGQRHTHGVTTGVRVHRRLAFLIGDGGFQRRFTVQQRHFDAGNPAVIVAALAVAVAVLKNGQLQPR